MGDLRRPPAPAIRHDRPTWSNASIGDAGPPGLPWARLDAPGSRHALLYLYSGMPLSDAFVAPGMTIRLFSTLS